MQRKIINELPDFPPSKLAASVKDIITKLLVSVPQQKAIPKQNKQHYIRVLKQIEWGISKVSPNWPEQIERMIDNLRKHLLDFESATNQSKSSSFICGGSKGKDIGHAFSYIMGYQQMFRVIAHYQDKNLKHDLVNNVLDLYEKENRQKHQSTKTSLPSIQDNSNFSSKEQNSDGCQNCKLYLSLSLQPNGSLAKNLLKSLPNTEWLMGILYEEGKVFPQDIAKAAQFYEKAATKNNPDSIYRLGSLNERGDYGRPYEYLNMWKKAAEMGNLQAITDMGFLYQKGLNDQDTGKTIVEKNSAKAHEYYLMASKQNFPRGLNNLGSFYQLDPTYKNKDKSIECFNKAVDAGYVKAMFNLALCYSQGFAGVSDSQKAKQLFKRAADLGDHYSKLFYVDLLLNGDTSSCSEDSLEQAHKFCRQMIAEEEDRAEAYYFLGIMYQSGLGAPQQPKTAFLYFTKAAKLSYVHGIMKLADCYKLGFGVEQDHTQALKLYEQASKTKPEALVSIGAIYQEGSDLVNRNYETAFKYYYEACNRNVAQAYNKLGNCYRMGRGCKKDQQKARQYFSKYQKLNFSQSYVSKISIDR